MAAMDSHFEKTFAMIKPDAVKAGKAEEICQLIEVHGFVVIVKAKLQVLSAFRKHAREIRQLRVPQVLHLSCEHTRKQTFSHQFLWLLHCLPQADLFMAVFAAHASSSSRLL